MGERLLTFDGEFLFV